MTFFNPIDVGVLLEAGAEHDALSQLHPLV
jgi:hypothetical protein